MSTGDVTKLIAYLDSLNVQKERLLASELPPAIIEDGKLRFAHVNADNLELRALNLEIVAVARAVAQSRGILVARRYVDEA